IPKPSAHTSKPTPFTVNLVITLVLPNRPRGWQTFIEGGVITPKPKLCTWVRAKSTHESGTDCASPTQFKGWDTSIQLAASLRRPNIHTRKPKKYTTRSEIRDHRPIYHVTWTGYALSKLRIIILEAESQAWTESATWINELWTRTMRIVKKLA
ncbi:hypothetical protein FRC01_010216, partial [Tulasnella sp. 417]